MAKHLAMALSHDRARNPSLIVLDVLENLSFCDAALPKAAMRPNICDFISPVYASRDIASSVSNSATAIASPPTHPNTDFLGCSRNSTPADREHIVDNRRTQRHAGLGY